MNGLRLPQMIKASICHPWMVDIRQRSSQQRGGPVHKSISTFSLTLGILLLASCAAPMDMPGEENTSGPAAVVENDWAIFDMPEIDLRWGKTRGTFSLAWQFVLFVKKPDVRRITIYDVTNQNEILLIDDQTAGVKFGHWKATTPKEEVAHSRMKESWFLSELYVKRTFKVVLTDSKGLTTSLVRNVVISRQERVEMLRALINNLGSSIDQQSCRAQSCCAEWGTIADCPAIPAPPART